MVEALKDPKELFLPIHKEMMMVLNNSKAVTKIIRLGLMMMRTMMRMLMRTTTTIETIDVGLQSPIPLFRMVSPIIWSTINTC